MYFLDFEDIEDFSNLPPGAFKEYYPEEEILNPPAKAKED